MTTRQSEFNDQQRAAIFARDRATCCFTGMSLWLLDYAGSPGPIDWVDHIVPASAGGPADLDNGACASWLYNQVRRESGGGIYLFLRGRPTQDFFTLFETIPEHIAAQFRRFSALHYSDWYFNRALFHIRLAASQQGQVRVNGQPFKRGLDYWAKASLGYLRKWRAIVNRERVPDLRARDLLPNEIHPDHKVALKLLTVDDVDAAKHVVLALAPYYKASWNALVELSQVQSLADAQRFLARIKTAPDVTLRVKNAIRLNVERLYG